MKLLQWLRPKKRNYVSDTDHFLQAFDQKHPKRSESQLKEIQKHRDIFNRKRDDRIQW